MKTSSITKSRKLNWALPAILFLFTLFSVTSCQKPLSDQNLKYIGSWGSDKYSLEIWKDGRGVYEKKNLSPYECRVVIESGQIQFKGCLHGPFTIDQDPYVDANGNKVMVLDGETFYKH